MTPNRKVCVVLIASLFLWLGGTAHAQLLSCNILSRSGAHIPQFVRDYLDRSNGPFVRSCGDGDHPQYFGTTSITKDGNTCRYSEYELDLSRTSPPHLQRIIKSRQTYMLITKFTCPSPVLNGYTATNGVPQNVFEHLIHTWRNATASLESFDKTFSGLSDANMIQQLRSAVVQNKDNHLVVLTVALRRDLGLWKSYELDVADPNHNDRFYAVRVSSWFGRVYGVSAVRPGIY